jgi:hypothetical protein
MGEWHGLSCPVFDGVDDIVTLLRIELVGGPYTLEPSTYRGRSSNRGSTCSEAVGRGWRRTGCRGFRRSRSGSGGDRAGRS